MDKIENPYQVMLERLRVLDQSIHILNLINNDFREILRKQKPLPKFIQESFKRSTINKAKSMPALPPPPPTETEEMRLAANIIDKAKRAIENVGEKKPKQATTVMPAMSVSTQPSIAQNNRLKNSSSVTRPSSASSTNLSSTSTTPAQPQSVRRYLPAHMKAPFQTQPEKKRRPSSITRNSVQINANQRPNSARRSVSQQRRQSTTAPTTQTPHIPSVQNEIVSLTHNGDANGINQEDTTSAVATTEVPIDVSNDIDEVEISSVPQPIILNRALIKPLRRLWKQNQTLRLRLKRAVEKKSISIPSFIDRLNEQIHSSMVTDEVRIPNIEVLLQLAVKLRAIVLYLLETSTFDDLENALRRLTTLKYLVNRYYVFFTPNMSILVAVRSSLPYHSHRLSNLNTNVAEWLTKSKSLRQDLNIIRYTDDSQLIAFTEVRFKQFETESRWIELHWHEQMIKQFQQNSTNQNQNPLQIYRELMSLVTGLQTSTPIVVENTYE